MPVEQAIVERLKSDSTVATLSGNRIYPDQAPQSFEYPCLVYGEADRRQVQTYSGPVAIDSWDLELTCYANSKAEARALSKAVRDSLMSNYTGTTTDDVRILGTFDRGEVSDAEIPVSAEERGIFSVTLSLNLWCRTV